MSCLSLRRWIIRTWAETATIPCLSRPKCTTSTFPSLSNSNNTTPSLSLPWLRSRAPGQTRLLIGPPDNFLKYHDLMFARCTVLFSICRLIYIHDSPPWILYFPLHLCCLFITCYFRCLLCQESPSPLQLTLHSSHLLS